jgi:NADPH-dependent 2,4-dienoyl-CoA reductase/sulfur reductase-like enzyme
VRERHLEEHVIDNSKNQVVGAGLGGAKTCEQLRLRKFIGRITLVAAERAAPYDRPLLTKGVLPGKHDDTTLPTDFRRTRSRHPLRPHRHRAWDLCRPNTRLGG